ncbi:AraC family transcriptional regulator [Pseudomonas gingeri]|uniref:AraC family transcriptional regulator n=1 Tax=Pseudomonas gingeri TaxID=117681 RepID=UPI0015A471F3|nr:AraC family transcriptional regulator [Pseudomonas gingeri]NWA26919.1 AraC family transcriptional regulator [Pseudomonas gingeri]
MNNRLDELKHFVRQHARGQQTATGMSRLSIMMGETRTGRLPGLYDPMICLVLQGAKRVMIGDQVLEYGAGCYFIASAEVPASGEVIDASPQLPYLAVALGFDAEVIASLLLEMPVVGEKSLGRSFAVNVADNELIDAFGRMLRLMARPQEIAVLAPLLEREILFRLLMGPQGNMLRQIARADSRLSRVRRVLNWIRQHYVEGFRVEDLARIADMSPSALHRHFKAITAMTPIQYQKRIRLHEARRRLLAMPGDAAGVAFDVGYESASQFSREYARLFGVPPARDVRQRRAKAEGEVSG